MSSPPPDFSQNKTAKRTYGRRTLAHKEKRKSELLTAGDNDVSDDGGEQDYGGHPSLPDVNADSITPKRRRTAPREQIDTGGRSTLSSPRNSPSPTPERKPMPPIDPPVPTSGLLHPSLATKRPKKVPDNGPSTEPAPAPSLPSPTLSTTQPAPPVRELQTKRPMTRTRSGNRIEHPDLSAIFAGVSPGRRASRSPAGSLDGHSDSEAGPSGSRPAMSRPSGLRRMLTKTQSLGDAVATPAPDERDDGLSQASPAKSWTSAPHTPPGNLRRYRSMPESPQVPSPVGSQAEGGLMPQIQAVQPGSGGKAKRTYGKVRTMLVELPKKGPGNGPALAAIDSEDTQESYTELRHKYEVDNTVLPNSRSANLLQEMLQARAPETVSDMRSRGENRRFIDELGYLLEGISEPTGNPAFKRSSAVDILQNMQDETWLTKMKICGQVDKAWDHFLEASLEDEIMRAACLLFLVVLMASGSGLEHVLSNDPNRTVALIVQSLALCDGPLDSAYNTKPVGSVIRLRQLAQQSVPKKCVGRFAITSRRLAEFGNVKLTTRHLASALLRFIYSGPLWVTAETALESESLSKLISGNLQREVFPVVKRFDLFEKGLDLVAEGDSVEFDYLDNCLAVLLSLVEKSKVQREEFLQTSASNAQTVINVAVISCNVALTSSDNMLEASSCVIRAIQLLAHLATAVPAWATAVIKSSAGPFLLARVIFHRYIFVGTADERRRRRRHSSTTTELDEDPEPTVEKASGHPEMSEEEFLCLGLALLTTSALTDDHCASLIARTNVQGGCVGDHGCLLRCQCISPVPLGRQLAHLYAKYQSRQDDPFAPILAGNLALLFSKLFNASPELSGSTVGALPGTSRNEKLQGLVKSLHELDDLQSAMQNTIGKLLPRGFVLEDDADEETIEEGEVVNQAVKDIEAFMD
ncbi:hypothetical protein IAR50_001930 [Cryptococcus sp. DSM 104548]